MTDKAVYLGDSRLDVSPKEIGGCYVTRKGEPFYRIENFDEMDDFFISVVSDSNHWLFISTHGGLSAGRTDCDSALFPYYTEDKIRDNSDHTGSRTIVLLEQENRRLLWEPFSKANPSIYAIQRNLYKNVLGDKLVFEETNLDLGIRFSYSWEASDRYGFVRTACLENIGQQPVSADVIDGIENILPYGVLAGTQNELSCLVDAYKKNERVADSMLAIYAMSSILSDRAEPSEALSATTVWSFGAEQPKVLLSSLQLDSFRKGKGVTAEAEILGRRGAYFLHQHLDVEVDTAKQWSIVADVNQGPAAVRDTLALLESETDTDIDAQVTADVLLGSENLRKLVATADGLQVTGDALSANHHAANVLFNIMRGGLFEDNYRLDKGDLLAFCRSWNAPVSSANADFFESLPADLTYHQLLDGLEHCEDPQLERLCREYLPISFSRRHGDPSRPWNRFAIRVRDEAGNQLLNYEGNWRDIFQNWEALGTSLPLFCSGMITKFVNASTADGHNPYRITRDGIDWERPEPENPWANIGYWGDHQLIYLLKLIEQSLDHEPDTLVSLMDRRIFCYANVPYRIRPYASMLENPNDTIVFDQELDNYITERVTRIGADGRLLALPDGSIYQVTLAEKILVTLLAKLANFIPDAGIWMNTQRPEWNDANNALVGTGVSVVTLCYLHRFLKQAISLFQQLDDQDLELSREVVVLFDDIVTLLDQHHSALVAGPVSDELRKTVMDGLGAAAEHYRSTIYNHGFSGEQVPLSGARLLDGLAKSLEVTHSSIRSNQRSDGLYHAYNRIDVGSSGVAVCHLYEMLEGQVAVLSSGALTPDQSLEVLRTLKNSALYTPRQHSYLLYPDRKLPHFIDRNVIPKSFVDDSKLLMKLRARNDRQLIEWDATGQAYFRGFFNNTAAVSDALDNLAEQGYEEVAAERHAVEDLFADLFDCANFTGRSGGMYAYEGLGSIYWHMVSKLLLAVMETIQQAEQTDCSPDTLAALRAAYYDVRAGIGFNKAPSVYGAFPTDPYSHTPGFSGARQPGMTGQVKEEVLTRIAELGVRVARGRVSFRPTMLRGQEFLQKPASLEYFDVEGEARNLPLESSQLAFTYCQVPIVYHQTGASGATVTLRDGRTLNFADNSLDAELSSSLFSKAGDIERIDVTVTDVLA